MKRNGKTLQPLEEGNPRRLTDFRCAWKNMTDTQRVAALQWLQTDAKDDGVVVIRVELGFPRPPMREPQVD